MVLAGSAATATITTLGTEAALTTATTLIGAAEIASAAGAIAQSTATLIDYVQIKTNEKENTTIDARIKIATLALLEQRPDDIVIYRLGNSSNSNLTPRTKDINGLSFSTKLPTQKCVITTNELINTELLKVIFDNPEHAAVLPIKNDLQLWINSRPTANTNPHYYTVLLKNLVIEV